MLSRYADEIAPAFPRYRAIEVAIRTIERTFDLADEPLSRLTPDAICIWRDMRLEHVGSAMVAHELDVFTVLLEIARTEWRWLDHDPALTVRRPRRPKANRARRVSDPETHAMCKALGYTSETMVASASGFAALAFVLAIETGLRKHEIMALRWTDLLISEGSLKVPGGSQGAGRTVPLSPRAIQLFGQLYRFEDEERCIPLRKEDSQRMWMDARKKAATIVPSVHDLNFNDSRHEATARLAKKFSLLPLSRMLDHGNLATLVTYYLDEA